MISRIERGLSAPCFAQYSSATVTGEQPLYEPPPPSAAAPLMRRSSGRALGLLAGFALDAAIGDPRRAHPVAAFGSAASRVESRIWSASRGRGIVFTALCAGTVTLAGAAVQRLASRSRAGGVVVTAAATWTVLGGASLAAEASGMARALQAGDLGGARRRLPALCGRDPDQLDEAGLARATVESLAENTSDAVVAPLLWGALCGIPGLLGYRAVNTLDAMVGHRSARYADFGWAAARLDDVVNLVPSRLTGLLAAVLARAVGGGMRQALAAMRRDGRSHPSPNAGQCEAAFAGALGIRLGGTNLYAGRAERRGVLGDGGQPATGDIVRAVRLSRLVGAAAVLLAAVLAHFADSVREVHA
jgi:adenosylcobinamide-phosphate synthase